MLQETKILPAKRLLSKTEFCLMYGVNVDTLRRWISNGYVKAYKLPFKRRGPRVFIEPISEELLKIKAKGTNDLDEIYFLKPAEVCELLGLKINSGRLRTLSRSGQIQSMRVQWGKAGSQRRYCIADVRRFIAQRKTKEKRPSRKAIRESMVALAKQRLGIPVDTPKQPVV